MRSARTVLVLAAFGLACVLARGADVTAHVEGCHALARCHRTGLGVDKDLKESETWLKKAAQLGHPEAVRLMQRSK